MPGSDLRVQVEDAAANPQTEATISIEDESGRRHLLRSLETGDYEATGVPSGHYHVEVSKEGFKTEEYEVELDVGSNRLALTIGTEGQLYYYAGGAKIYLERGEEQLLLAVRGRGAGQRAEAILETYRLAGAARDPQAVAAPTRRDQSFVRVEAEEPGGDPRGALKQAISALESEGFRVIPALKIQRGAGPPTGLTNRLLVRFADEIGDAEVARTAERHGLTVQRRVPSAGNAHLLSTNDLPSYSLLDTARQLLDEPAVELVEPDLLIELEVDQYSPNDTLFNLQTHLPLINSDDAWETLGDYDLALRGGSPGVCIAIFDTDGVAPNHPDLIANLTDGTSKLIVSFDFVSMVAQTVANLDGDHGTQCAGTATAAFDNNRGIAGVAPNCHLIGAELPSPATGTEMADAFLWAAGIDNGNTDPAFPALPSQPADVISNSWGSTGTALSAALQGAFDRLTDDGREGRGCIVTFSLGNLGYVQFSNQRTYAAYNRTIAVGASINVSPTNPVTSSQADPNGNFNNIATAVDTRALYSPFGPEIDLVAPSHTCYAPAGGGLVDPTTSSVRVGTGALDGCPGAGVCNDYATTFGGTSHASPTVAGAAALVMSANPLLSWQEVRAILRRTAVRIDAGNTNAIGQWVDNDGDGFAEFSQWYGYGRLDVAAAVQEALGLYVAQLLQLADVRAS